MMDLLDSMPAQWNPDTESLRIIMAALGRAGTLTSARTCQQLYHKHSELQHRLTYMAVLEAYWMACRQSSANSSSGLSVDIAKEVCVLLQNQWDRALPKHRVDRIVHCTIVLNCLATAARACGDTSNNSNDDDEADNINVLHDMANALAKAAIGGDSWAQLWKKMESESPKVDSQTLPVLNYLTQLYATPLMSRNPHGLVESAKKMLHYMMHHKRDSLGRPMVVPDVHTCNVVLQALLKRNRTPEKDCTTTGRKRLPRSRRAKEGGFTTAADAETSRNASSSSSTLDSDFAFAQRVLSYMLRHKDVECWPNPTTYNLMFEFLDLVQYDNIGALAEEWLSWMEAKQFLLRSNSNVRQKLIMMNRNNNSEAAGLQLVKLGTYHHVMQCLLKEAQTMATENSSKEDEVDENNATNSSLINESLPCVRAFRLLERLEIQSTPLLLCAPWIKEQLPDLYDTDVQPNRSTYRRVLQICAVATDPHHCETAAAVALDVYQRYDAITEKKSPPQQVARGTDHEMSTLLVQCAEALPETSPTRQAIEAYLAYRSVDSSEMVTEHDVEETA